MPDRTKFIFCYQLAGLNINIAEGEDITGYTVKEGGEIFPTSSIWSVPHSFHSMFGSKGTIWDRGIPPWKPYGYKNDSTIKRAQRIKSEGKEISFTSFEKAKEAAFRKHAEEVELLITAARGIISSLSLPEPPSQCILGHSFSLHTPPFFELIGTGDIYSASITCDKCGKAVLTRMIKTPQIVIEERENVSTED